MSETGQIIVAVVVLIAVAALFVVMAFLDRRRAREIEKDLGEQPRRWSPGRGRRRG